MATDVPQRYLSIAAIAKRWDVSTRTVRRRIADGTLTAYRVGPHLIRLDVAEVDALLQPLPSAADWPIERGHFNGGDAA